MPAVRDRSPKRRAPRQLEANDMPLVPLGGTDGEERAPRWALALQDQLGLMQDSMSSRLDRMIVVNEQLADRMSILEAKHTEDHARMDKIEKELSDLRAKMEHGGRSTISAPSEELPSPRVWRPVEIPPPAILRDESDFNHLVLGGWQVDTRRQIIEADL